MDAYAAPVAGPSNSQSSPQQCSSAISSDALTPRRSSKNFHNNASTSSPPSTPPNRRRTRQQKRDRDRDKRPLRHSASLPNGIDNPQHSHGLSWSSTTRDSVVDGLLFSLDNLSKKDVARSDGIDDLHFDKSKYRFPDLPALQTTRTARRARGHTHSSSLSTDYDLSAMPESPPRMSLSTAGRKSTSGSHRRLSSINNNRTSLSKASRTSTDTQKPTTSNAVAAAIVAPKESGERGRPNQDFDTIAEKAKKRWKRRSMSVDQIFADSVISPGGSMLDRGRPVPSMYSKYDASYEVAPEPMIAGGPRRKDNPTATGPVYLNQAPQRSTLRKVTTHTDLRTASAQGPQSPPIPQEVRNQATDFVRMSNMQSRPVTGDQTKGQPSITSYPFAQKPPPQPPKERPGFFRRVFGGSSSRNTPTQSARTQIPDHVEAATSNVRSSTSNNEQTRTGTRQSSREGDPPTSAPALNKKSSSLFRRRKKSLSEAPPPPPVPAAYLNVSTGEPSPLADSFRKAMDPYLGLDGKRTSVLRVEKPVSRPSSRESATEDSDNPDIFHSGYTQRPDASLGTRELASRSSGTKTTASDDKDEGSKTKMKIKKRKPDTLIPMNTSFLLDPSSQEPSGTPTGSSERASPIIDPSSKENTLPRPASKASTADRTLASPISPVDSRFDGRKPSVISTVGSEKNDDASAKPNTQDRPGSKTSDRVAPQSAVEGILLSNALSIVPESQSRSETVRSPTNPTGSGAGVSPSVHSPISPQSQYHSATSLPLPSSRAGEDEVKISSELVDDGAEYRERARKIYEGDEEDVTKAEAAPWLGEKNTLSTRTLAAYLDLFDFTGVNVLAALRMLCGKLTLKGETQQFDRIITALSARWCACNPNHGFKAQDVVHTICYSLILLNTDLHLADIEGKMSRSAYVKNTLPTIRRVVVDAAPNAFDDTIRPSPLATRPTLPWSLSSSSIPQTPPNERRSIDQEGTGAQKKLSNRPIVSRQDSDMGETSPGAGSGSNALVNQPWTGTMRAWESEVENILKSFFVAIKIEPLPLHGAPVPEQVAAERNLPAANLGVLKRTNSVVSKTPSDTTSFLSKPGLKSMTMGFPNKYSLSRTKLYPASTLSSSRTSFDDGNSVFSPAQSTWSKYSFSKTLTSASMQSLGHHSAADFKHSIGFANALSQAIIREEHAGLENDSSSVNVPGGLLDDEALTLQGAPWAKEGLVKHKHHLETPGKKAKERNWIDCFAVISKGKLTLFAFNTSTKTASTGRRTLTKGQVGGRAGGGAAQTVGGGDWMENAEQLDSFVLRQTIASTLPPPGYSKTRPNVWALSLPTGAVHLFQVGTLEIAREFMTTANYWSARLSKEPLSGGVSNVEYGWSEQVINPALVERSASPSVNASTHAPPPASMQTRPQASGHKHSTSVGTLSKQSVTSSIRTSLDTGFGAKPRMPGDKVHLADWQPPTQSMMASQLMEVDQLRALTAYVGNVEAELARHNELKSAIDLAFSPRHANYGKAMANWQRKSDYLLRENVKFQTYVDSLTVAQKAREKFYADKNFLLGEEERKEAAGDAEPAESSMSNEEKANGVVDVAA